MDLNEIRKELEGYKPTEKDIYPGTFSAKTTQAPAVEPKPFQPAPDNKKGLICTNCGTVGAPKTVTKGSFLIEIVLWCFLFVPGIIYSLWRLTTRTKGCRFCGAGNMVPLNSPVGRKLQSGFTQSI